MATVASEGPSPCLSASLFALLDSIPHGASGDEGVRVLRDDAASTGIATARPRRDWASSVTSRWSIVVIPRSVDVTFTCSISY
jgi:hypothetical protein